MEPMTIVAERWHCAKCSAKPKPPIYSVEVIEVACRALDTVSNLMSEGIELGEDAAAMANEFVDIAVRIIRDGLASHEKAIKGES